MNARALCVLLLVLVGALLGCSGASSNGIELPRWTLDAGEATSRDVELPAQLDSVIPAGARTYTLETDVDIPPELQGVDLELAFGAFEALPEVAVDGEHAPQLDRSIADRHRSSRLLRFQVPRGTRHHLALTVPIVWAHSTWVGSTPRLVPAGQGMADWVVVEAVSHGGAAMALATCAFVALVYGILALAVTGTQRRTFSLFAFGALLNVTYPAMVLGLTQPVFGRREIAASGIALSLAAVCAIYSAKRYFQMAPPARGWLVFGAACVVVGIAGSDPFRAPWTIAAIVGASTLANTAAQTRLVWNLRNAENRPANLRAISFVWLLTAALGVPDFLLWVPTSGALRGLQSGCIGLSIVLVFQIVALLRDHIRSIAKGEALNLELAARVRAVEAKQREVERLNDDLRRQISARSRQLAQSLSRQNEGLSSAHELAPGEVVNSRYEIRGLLGSGGMGAVHEVTRLEDGMRFAMKIASRADDPIAHARFAQEAQIAANLKHANVVSIVDFDVAREGFIYLVMELVDGITLEQAQQEPRSLAWKLHVLARISDGLAAIHAQAIVHRDLKPANVLLSESSDPARPSVKIADFGVSTLVADELESVSIVVATPSRPPPKPASSDATVTFAPPGRAAVQERGREPPMSRELTKPGMVFGTPFYVAPELASLGRAGPAADIFSFGSVAYRLLTGERPFAECPLRAMLDGRVLPPPSSLADKVTGIDRKLAVLIESALAYEPTTRPTARELTDALSLDRG